MYLTRFLRVIPMAALSVMVLSPLSYSQDEEPKEDKEEPKKERQERMRNREGGGRPGGGQGGQGGRAQRMQNLSAEERKQMIMDRINRDVTAILEGMGDSVPTENQDEFVKKLVGFYVGGFKVQSEASKEMAAVRESGDRQKMRDARTKMAEKLSKHRSQFLKEMRGYFVKDDFKKFRKVFNEVSPEPQQRGGPGGRGGGGGGARGGGGGGGGR